MIHDHEKQLKATVFAVENARRELCTLNEIVEEDLRIFRLQGIAGEKHGMALKRALITIDKAYSGFSGFPGIEVDLRDGGFC